MASTHYEENAFFCLPFLLSNGRAAAKRQTFLSLNTNSTSSFLCRVFLLVTETLSSWRLRMHWRFARCQKSPQGRGGKSPWKGLDSFPFWILTEISFGRKQRDTFGFRLIPRQRPILKDKHIQTENTRWETIPGYWIYCLSLFCFVSGTIIALH